MKAIHKLVLGVISGVIVGAVSGRYVFPKQKTEKKEETSNKEGEGKAAQLLVEGGH